MSGPTVVIEPDAERLAQAFVEGSTEFDLAEVPSDARALLVEWCRAFILWAREEVESRG